MEKTPLSLRTHVSVFGETNAGKSALFNKLLDQDMSIVSEISGTTTDPVTKAMELIPYGPIALTDTAGLGDTTAIGEKRTKRTERILERTDFAIYAAPCDDFNREAYKKIQFIFAKKKIDHLLVFTKADLGTNGLENEFPNAVFVSVNDAHSIDHLRSVLSERLSALAPDEQTMIGSLLSPGSTVVLVIPIDAEAPKGRLILPQVQLIRDCLDHGIRAVCVKETELKETLDYLPKTDMVITDSQAFALVSNIVPRNIPLTSFSMLMAAMKGDIRVFAEGAQAIASLKDGDKILMAEACTHNVSHEDIGRVKIPALIRKHTGKQLEFEYFVHQDFPESLSEYALVIHCGGCMINSRVMKNRTALCREYSVPITNYGTALAYLTGILDRSSSVFGL